MRKYSTLSPGFPSDDLPRKSLRLAVKSENYGGTEGNAHTLRVLAKIGSYTHSHGFNLTRGTLLGILKYPASYPMIRKTELPEIPSDKFQMDGAAWLPPGCYMESEQDIVDWILGPLTPNDRKRFLEYRDPAINEHGHGCHKSLYTSIMDLADDISYGVHDFEDSLELGLLNRTHWEKVNARSDYDWVEEMGLSDAGDKLFGTGIDAKTNRKQAIASIINRLAESVRLKKTNDFTEPVLAYNVRFTKESGRFLKALHTVFFKHVVLSQSLETMHYRWRRIVISLFDAISSNPEGLLNATFSLKYKMVESDSKKMRVISDYIAGMSDNEACLMYERLFTPTVCPITFPGL